MAGRSSTVHLPTQKNSGSDGSVGGAIEVKDFGQFAKSIRDNDREIWRLMRQEMKVAAQPVVADAKSRSSWSTRIPRTIKASTTMKGVSIRAGGKSAPHAAPYEVGSKSAPAGYLRHPVFGHREQVVSRGVTTRRQHYVSKTGQPVNMVLQKTRPFMGPALMAQQDKVAELMMPVLDKYARSIGFS